MAFDDDKNMQDLMEDEESFEEFAAQDEVLADESLAASSDEISFGEDDAAVPPDTVDDESDEDLLAQARSASSKGGKQAWDKATTRRLFRRYKEKGDEEARQQLIENHLNLVRFLAAKFRNRGESMEDLIQVGSIGLINAIDRFDISRGLEFTTFATPTIMGELRRHFRDKGWAVRVPRRLQELSAKVNKVTEELAGELSRPPTTDEVAQRLGVSVDEVLEAMESSSAYSSVSLDSSSGDDEGPSVMDTYASEDTDLSASDDRMLVEEIISSFSPHEKDVIRMRFYEGLTQVEIAERMGISQVQVSRLLRRTLKRIQEELESSS